MPDFNITFFPNPSNGNVRLKFNESLSKDIKIYNPLGNIVLEKVINEIEIELNLENLSSGFYILILKEKYSGKIYSTKLIIHH